MEGLSIRWDLTATGTAGGTAAGTAEQLAERLRHYVAEQSLPRFTGRPGLCFKTWRMRPGEWFEGTYVFDTAADRDAFEAWFLEAPSPVTELTGAGPVLVEHFEVVAVAEGGAGFRQGAASVPTTSQVVT